MFFVQKRGLWRPSCFTPRPPLVTLIHQGRHYRTTTGTHKVLLQEQYPNAAQKALDGPNIYHQNLNNEGINCLFLSTWMHLIIWVTDFSCPYTWYIWSITTWCSSPLLVSNVMSLHTLFLLQYLYFTIPLSWALNSCTGFLPPIPWVYLSHSLMSLGAERGQ